MRILGFLLLACSLLRADVVILKDGGKVVGRVKEKGTHYEVTTDVGLRTFLKEEVERVVTTPEPFLGDADALYEEAKKDYQKAATLDTRAAEKNQVLKESVKKLNKAREQVAGTRELFPGDKYSSLDKKLVRIMMLLRMARSSFTSERIEPRRPRLPSGATPAPRAPAPADPAVLEKAFATLVDVAKRTEQSTRKRAHDVFHDHRASSGGLHDLVTAAMLFLARSDGDWKLTGPALEEIQKYFSRPWLKNFAKLTPASHLEATSYLTGRIAAIRSSDARGAVDALALFALGHLGYAPGGAEREKQAREAGFEAAHGRVGTVEGLALADMHSWIGEGNYDLAMAAFVNEHKRRADTPGVRLIWSWALLHHAIEKRKGFERPVKALAAIRGPNAAAKAHFTAVRKSIQDITPCIGCGGEGWLRCTNCHGKKEIIVICPRCKGKRLLKNRSGTYLFCNACSFTGIRARLVCRKCKDGFFDCRRCKLPKCTACGSSGRTPCKTCKGSRIMRVKCVGCKGYGLDMTAQAGGRGFTDYDSYLCKVCAGTGHSSVQNCSACPNGFIDCTRCEPLRKPPAIEDICDVTACTTCEGRGSLFRGAEWTCHRCLGLGLRLVPLADPDKVLPD